MTTWSYIRESATWDEPQHLVTGYVAWKYGDYRFDCDNPRLLRMWSALPLLAMPVNAPSAVPVMDGDGQIIWTRDFLYRQNDADRLLLVARFMTVLLGLGAGWLLFSWAREWFGLWPAAVVLAFYTVEPNILTHARLVTTDMGITTLYLGAVYFLWRVTRTMTVVNLAGLAIFTGLAFAAKYTAVLLVPIIGLTLGLRLRERRPWLWCWRGQTLTLSSGRHRVLMCVVIVAAVALTTWGVIWAVHGFRFLPSADPDWRYAFHREVQVNERVPGLVRAIGWVDAHRLLPNVYSQGFLSQQANAQCRLAYLNGTYSVTGWWYYFPIAFLLKTPVALLLLVLAGLWFCGRDAADFRSNAWPVLVTLVVLWSVAIGSRINIGYRHLLPAVPFLLLLAGKSVVVLLSRPSRARVMLVLALVMAAVLEVAVVAPHYTAFINRLVGGPVQGWRYLADSNLDWGQDLKGLKHWMDQHRVDHINLAYFGTSLPAYYGISYTPVAGMQLEPRQRPRLPGYVAVSVTQLLGVYNPRLREYYRALLRQEPVTRIGYSIHVYRVEEPWGAEP